MATPADSPPSYLLSPGAVASIAVSAAITITILALLCCCCCCRHTSKSSQDRESSISRLQSSTPTSELGLVQEPVSMLEMDSAGRGLVVEEPPPAYYTLEHRPLPLPLPVEAGAETRWGAGPEIGAGVEAWNGFHVDSDLSRGMNPRTITPEAPTAGPVVSRNMNLRVRADVSPVVHAADGNAEEEEEGTRDQVKS